MGFMSSDRRRVVTRSKQAKNMFSWAHEVLEIETHSCKVWRRNNNVAS